MYTCRHCGRAHASRSDFELHLDRCVRTLLTCTSCGARFPESTATTDGWRYRCPESDCDAEGLGEELLCADQTVLATSR